MNAVKEKTIALCYFIGKFVMHLKKHILVIQNKLKANVPLIFYLTLYLLSLPSEFFTEYFLNSFLLLQFYFAFDLPDHLDFEVFLI